MDGCSLPKKNEKRNGCLSHLFLTITIVYNDRQTLSCLNTERTNQTKPSN